jgi:hypothetical protein
MSPVILAVVLVVIAIAFALGVAFGRARRLRRRPDALARREPRVARVAFDPIAPFGAGSRSLSECPQEWRAQMAAVGERLRGAGVRAVVFVHGTFAGNDPVAAARLLGRVLGARVERALHAASKAVIDASVGETANWTPEYVDLFEQAIGGGLPCVRFAWSSENHHAARVVGAVRLARFIASTVARVGSGERVLLVGHSHGGQLFAIVSHLLAGGETAATLLDAARGCGEDTRDLDASLAALRCARLDVATFGTPPRYTWADVGNVRAIHVVNHRGPLSRAGLGGLLRTRDGDYVALLGGPGSDWPALDPAHRRANARLDALLDRGSGLRTWLAGIRRAPPSPGHGDTLLVDYRDASARAPNWRRTWFGHAAYTRGDAMLFNARLIAEQLYPERRALRSA